MNKSFLYLLDIVIDFSRDLTENKKIIVFLVIYLLNRYRLIETLSKNEYYKQLITSFIKEFVITLISSISEFMVW